MKYIKLFEQFQTELIISESLILEAEEKDWLRMADLYLNDKSGANVAKSIKDKKKAISRYVTGLKIAGDNFPEEEKYIYKNSFEDFYSRAKALGATYDEVKLEFDKLGNIPENILTKISIFAAKSFGSWVTGDLAKAVYNAGFDMKFDKGGNAMTYLGKEAMASNGAKWTIGYTASIVIKHKDKPNSMIEFKFDAITDEGVDNKTIKYAMVSQRDGFSKLDTNTIYSKTEFIRGMVAGLQELEIS
jgi:hypothetical protein